MTFKMIRPKNETEDLLLSITKNCETLIQQTQRKAGETLEYKLTKPRETFHFNPPISIQGSWMLGLTSLEIYYSIFNITENNKFELYTDTIDEFFFIELRDAFEEILNISDIAPYHQQHEKIGPRIVEVYRKLKLEKSTTDAYIILSMAFARSPFKDFESHLRIVIGLDEDDIQLVLKQYNSNFVTYKLKPGIY